MPAEGNSCPGAAPLVIEELCRHTLPWPSILWHIYSSPLGLKAFLDNTIDLKKIKEKELRR